MDERQKPYEKLRAQLSTVEGATGFVVDSKGVATPVFNLGHRRNLPTSEAQYAIDNPGIRIKKSDT